MKNIVDLISEKKYHNDDEKWWESEDAFEDDIHSLIEALFDDKLTLDLDGEKYKLSLEGKRKDIYIKAEKIDK